MAYDFQVVVDAARSHELAEWWANASGWVVEPSDPDFIRRMIEQGYATEDDTMTHNGELVWRDGAAISHPDWPDRGQRRRILFQLVPDVRSCPAMKLRMSVAEVPIPPSPPFSPNSR